MAGHIETFDVGVPATVDTLMVPRPPEKPLFACICMGPKRAGREGLTGLGSSAYARLTS